MTGPTSLMPALRSACHAAPLAWLPHQLPRCSACGHRQRHPVSGVRPAQTRDLMRARPAAALRIAVGELASRHAARRK